MNPEKFGPLNAKTDNLGIIKLNSVTVCDCNFWQKEIGTKAARKMLAK